MVFRETPWLRSLLISACALVLAGPAHAANRRWSGQAADDFFSTAANWQNGLAPGSGDVAQFGRSIPVFQQSYTVAFNNNPTNQAVHVEDDIVTFDLNGHAYATTSAFAIVVGTETSPAARLTIVDGFFSTAPTADIQIGAVAGGSGTFTVGAGGLVFGIPEVFVGHNGTGTFTVTGGGDVVAVAVRIGLGAGTSGTATVTGSGSSLNSGEVAVGGLGTGSFNVLAGANVDSSSGQLGGSQSVAATISGPGSTWEVSANLLVGLLQGGTMSITAGGQVEDLNGVIGSSNTATGFGLVEVKDPNSKWTHRGDLRVGGAGGIGTMMISNGGMVENSTNDATVVVGDSGLGTVNVDGPNSKWLNASDLTVGKNSTGDNVVRIINGGFVQNADAILGDLGPIDGEPDRGTMIVSDPGSRWNSSSLTVGDGGHGTLNVHAGGRVEAGTSMIIGLEALGEVLVDGPGSELLVDGAMRVGVGGTGSLTITGGGRVASSSAQVPLFNGAGEVTVSGEGSTWDIGDNLSTSPAGEGEIHIQPGGTVNVANSITLNQDDELRLKGGTLRAGSINFQGSSAAFEWTSGRLSVGEIETFQFVIPGGGVLAPGRELGETIINGGLSSSSAGTIEIQIGGTAPGTTFDRIRVGGGIALNGTLEVELANGFVPSPTDAFTVITTGINALSGSFVNAPSGQRLATADGLGSFLVSYSPGSPQVVLSAFQAQDVPGDYNQNGIVDAADYIAWRKNLGNGTSLPNDNTPGVGPDDYIRWRARFGQIAGTGAGTTLSAVPEPATIVLLVSAACGALSSNRAPLCVQNSLSKGK